jgi:hypothetical protein
MLNITMAPELKRQIRRVPLPPGVKWSHVFQVMMKAAVAEKMNMPQDEFRKMIDADEKYKLVREWLKKTHEDYLD